MAVRRWGAGAILVLAMTAGLVACDPAVGSGLTIKATSKTTGLEPGAPISVRIAGAEKNQTLQLYACANNVDCVPHATRMVKTDSNGAVTVSWPASGVASHDHWAEDRPGVRTESCRPPSTCRLYVATGFDPETGPVGRAATSVAYTLKGRQAEFTATPTDDLVGGERITIQGRVQGAAGRTVRIARVLHFTPRNNEYMEKVGGSTYVTVRSDGTFSGTFTLPADPADADCAKNQGREATSDTFCYITAWIVKADGSAIDPTFGKPYRMLDFAPYVLPPQN